MVRTIVNNIKHNNMVLIIMVSFACPARSKPQLNVHQEKVISHKFVHEAILLDLLFFRLSKTLLLER